MHVALKQENGTKVVELTLSSREYKGLLRHLDAIGGYLKPSRGLVGMDHQSRMSGSLDFARSRVDAEGRRLIDEVRRYFLAASLCYRLGLRLTTRSGFKLKLGPVSIGRQRYDSLLIVPSDPASTTSQS